MRSTLFQTLLGCLALAGSVLVLSDCGGSSPSPTFTRDVRGAETAVGQVNRELAKVLQSASRETDRKLARQLTPLAARADDQVKRLETLIPPSSVINAFSAWRSALSRRAVDLHTVIAALRSHDAGAARSATQSLLIDSGAAATAQRQLDGGLG